MNATEAHQRATELLTKEVNIEYATIKRMIGDAVGKGKFECWVYNTSIKPEVRVKLISEGYKVGLTQTDRNETLTKITW